MSFAILMRTRCSISGGGGGGGREEGRKHVNLVLGGDKGEASESCVWVAPVCPRLG